MSTSASGVVPTRAVAACLVARDLNRFRRHPTTTFRILFFPVFFVVIVTGMFGSAASLPGFPARSLLDWVLPTGFVAAAVSAAIVPAFAMARDIESGFFDRLLLSPVRPVGLVIAPVVSAAARAVVPFLVVLLLGFGAGVRLPGGPAGLATALLAAEGSAMMAGSWGVGLSLRLASVRRIIAPLQLVNFAVLYMSTAQLPVVLMRGWLRLAARVNPMSQVLALGRQGFIGPVTWHETWPGLAVLIVGNGLLWAYAVRGLSRASRP